MNESKWIIDKENNIAKLQDNNGEVIASIVSFCGRLVLTSSFLEDESYIKLKSTNLKDATLESNKLLHQYCLEKIHKYTELKFNLPSNSILE